MNSSENAFIFIVGSPRSGTTILGKILDLHPEITQWYEPYFMWDKYFRLSQDDERTEEEASPKVSQYIRKNFHRYRDKSKCSFIVDKSPRNSLKIPFIKQIFPGARFIHIIRDGRDTTLSINQEWNKRLKIVEGSLSESRFDYGRAMKVIRSWLDRQPFMYDRLRALWFETHGHILNKNKHTNQLRWNRKTGWGPRFRDWEKYLSKNTLLQFNAYQWENCVRKSLQDLREIDVNQKLTLYYENFVQKPIDVLEEILNFIEAENLNQFYNHLPEIKKGNFNKWKMAFTQNEIEEIKPILTPTLNKLGYLEKWPW